MRKTANERLTENVVNKVNKVVANKVDCRTRLNPLALFVHIFLHPALLLAIQHEKPQKNDFEKLFDKFTLIL